jgi:methylthioribose-1-phosphate isomerase
MEAFRIEQDRILLPDQTRLPWSQEYRELVTYRDAGYAIADLRAEGAPIKAALVAAGMTLASKQARRSTIDAYREDIYAALDFYEKIRPGVPAARFIARARALVQEEYAIDSIADYLRREAETIRTAADDDALKIAANGAAVPAHGDGVLICGNYGSLAALGGGWTTGIIAESQRRGHALQVFIAETRPYLQGARISAWELRAQGVEVTVIADAAAATLMRSGQIKRVIAGAEAIAGNGDVIGCLGTYALALAASAHGVPFHIAASTATVSAQSAAELADSIPDRPVYELAMINGKDIMPEGAHARNPVADITPAKYITGYITEKGVLEAGTLKQHIPA